MQQGAKGVTGGVQADSSGSFNAYTLVQLANQCPAWEKKHIAPLMAAIALAESGGDPKSENYCCVGLWQINVLAHTQYTRAQMKDPLQNLRAACAIYASQGLAAWESYTNGAYKKYEGQVAEGIKNAGGEENAVGGIFPKGEEALGKAAEGALSWTSDLGKILSFLTSSQGWTRIGKVILGATLMVIAVDQLSKIGPGPDTNVGGAAKSGASKAGGIAKRSPTGKIVRSRGNITEAAALGAK